MFKNIFPDKLNRLVYKKGPKQPENLFKSSPLPKERRAIEDRTPAKQADAIKEEAAKILDKQGAPAKANKWIENILISKGNRVRHKILSKFAAQKLASGVTSEIRKFMVGKKEVHLPAKNGNTLLIKKVGSGFVAVAHEAQGNARSPKPSERLVYGRVSNPNMVAANMVTKFLGTDLSKKQEKLAQKVGPARSPGVHNDPRADRKAERGRFMDNAVEKG